MCEITGRAQRFIWILAIASTLLFGTAIQAQPQKDGVTKEADAKKGAPAPPKAEAAPKEPEKIPDPVDPTEFTFGFWIVLFVLYVASIAFTCYNRDAEYILKLKPSFFFYLGLFYLSLLLFVAVAYVTNMYNLQKQFPDPIGGAIPIAVPWFGALGAVFLSLQGVFSRSSSWDPNYNHWHIARPLIGGVVGIVSFYLLVLINTASGAEPTMGADKNKNRFIYYVAAFLVGYRERIFRDLLARATDLILAPGGVTESAPVVTVKLAGARQTEIPFGDSPVAAPAPRIFQIEILNSGHAALAAPRILVDTTSAAGTGTFVSVNDLVSHGGDLGPSQSRTVGVQFTPVAGQACTGTLTVVSTSLPAVTIKLSGKGI